MVQYFYIRISIKKTLGNQTTADRTKCTYLLYDIIALTLFLLFIEVLLYGLPFLYPDRLIGLHSLRLNT